VRKSFYQVEATFSSPLASVPFTAKLSMPQVGSFAKMKY